MKLKELPESVFTAWKLRRIPLENLLNKHQSIPVIVSLTSIPSRLKSLHLVIRSILNQTQPPEKIVLWLHKDLRESIPNTLAELLSEAFQIHYGDLTCPHRKLVHTLDLYSGHTIVTCDDDVMYRPRWLERLYQDHLAFPHDVIAHECREITYRNGEPAPYKEWLVQHRAGTSSTWMMPIGYGGVLYPAGSLHKDVVREDLYLTLAPKADDLWFKAMSYLQGTKTRRVQQPERKPIPIVGAQKVSLKHINVRGNGNVEQWHSICDHYDIRPNIYK